MSNMTHEQLVEKVAAIIDPKSAGDFRAYRPAERLYAESLAKEIIAVIAEETKEPTEAMMEKSGYRSMHAASPLYPEGK